MSLEFSLAPQHYLMLVFGDRLVSLLRQMSGKTPNSKGLDPSKTSDTSTQYFIETQKSSSEISSLNRDIIVPSTESLYNNL